MTTLLLVRHALTTSPPDILVGRVKGVLLSEEGREQAQRLANQLASLPISAIWSSPMERAIDTAKIISSFAGVAWQVAESLNEIDYGEWTGKRFDMLASDPIWQRYIGSQANIRIPGGETIQEVQHRVMVEINGLAKAHHDEMILLVTHAEIIRIVLSCFLQLPKHPFHRLEISHASTSAVSVDSREVRILMVNYTGDFYPLGESYSIPLPGKLPPNTAT
jgi:broad specificity phosphatase PhoE